MKGDESFDEGRLMNKFWADSKFKNLNTQTPCARVLRAGMEEFFSPENVRRVGER